MWCGLGADRFAEIREAKAPWNHNATRRHGDMVFHVPSGELASLAADLEARGIGSAEKQVAQLQLHEDLKQLTQDKFG